MKLDEAILRSLVIDRSLTHQIRVTPLRYATTPLGTGFGKTRLASPDRSFQVLYLGYELVTSVAETIIRDRFVDRSRRVLTEVEIESWGATEVASTQTLSLVDLRGMGPTRLSVPTDALLARNQAAGRRLSKSLYDQFPFVDGVLYNSRHVKKDCIAVYDRAIHKLTAGPVHSLIVLPALAPALLSLDISLIAKR